MYKFRIHELVINIIKHSNIDRVMVLIHKIMDIIKVFELVMLLKENQEWLDRINCHLEWLILDKDSLY